VFESVSAVRKLSRPSIEDMMVWNHWGLGSSHPPADEGRWGCYAKVDLFNPSST